MKVRFVVSLIIETRMNVAFIGFFHNERVNGVMTSSHNLAESLIDAGVRVFYCYYENESKEMSGLRVQHRSFKQTFLSTIAASGELEEYFRINDDKIDLVHLHSVFISRHVFIVRILQRLNIPYVITPHGGYNKTSLERTFSKNSLLKRLYFKLFELYVVKNAAGVIALTMREGDDIRALGVKKSVAVIPNTTRCSAIDRDYLKNSDQTIILYLGRFDLEFKGLEFLLETYELLLRSVSNLKLMLVGEGKDRTRIENLVNRKRLTNVLIQEPVYGTAKDKLIQSCTLYFQPSRSEAFGMSLIEAMSFGKPVILTQDSYLAPMLVDHSVGVIVPYAAPKAAEMIEFYLKDRSRLEWDGRRGREFVAYTFNRHRVANETLAFYNRIISRADIPATESMTSDIFQIN